MEKSKKKSENKAVHEPLEANHQKQLPRLNRIEGQVRGLRKMIETERDCLEICQQLSAIMNALRRVQIDMLREHLSAVGEALITENIPPKKRREMADEIGALLKQLS